MELGKIYCSNPAYRGAQIDSFIRDKLETG